MYWLFRICHKLLLSTEKITMASSYMPPAKSDVHLTPDIIFSIIEDKWNIKKEIMFDPCPVNPTNDGLKINWSQFNFVNPPYSKEEGSTQSLLEMFVEKAHIESLKNKTTILLLPCKTDQKWFHNYVIPRLHSNPECVIWIKGRLKFKNNQFAATQPHFLVKF